MPAFLGVQLVSPLCGILAGAAAMAGHYRPLFLRFQKGGKMVATAGGVFLGVAALVALGAAVVWLVTFAITRYASVSSIMAALSLPVSAFVFDYSTAVIVLSFVSARRCDLPAPGEPEAPAHGHREPHPAAHPPRGAAVAVPAPEFARLVTLACHDLRTPLATVNGFAKTLVRGGELDEQSARFVGLIDQAGEQMGDLLDLLVLAARIEAGTYEPSPRAVDTLDLVASADERITASGAGETIRTDEPAMRRSLAALASAALRHGEVPHVAWTVSGRELSLDPVTPGAARVITGEETKDLGALVARMAIEAAGGSLAVAGETLRVFL